MVNSEPSTVDTCEAVADILVRLCELSVSCPIFTSDLPEQWVQPDCPVDGELCLRFIFPTI